MVLLSILPVILAGIAVFLLVIFLLAFLILFAKAKLVASGRVKLDINHGEKVIEVGPGSSLLSTLANEQIFLSSACGGKGTCAMCKCQVFEGGGEALSTEKPYFTRKQLQNHYRLGCQVKVKQDMKIHIPEEVFGIKKWACTVRSNYNVASFIKEFVVELPPGESLNFKSGGYIQIDVPPVTVDFKNIDITAHPRMQSNPNEYRAEWDKFKLWDLKMVNEEQIFRAYSMANHPAEGNIVMLNIRIATPPWDRATNTWMKVNPGLCSSYIFSRKPGDKVMVSGPYGEFFIKDTNAEMVYIGGGAGMAPMRSHIFHLFHTLRTNRKVSYWYGGRSKRELFYVDDFKAIEKEFPNFKFNMVLSEPLPEDNWKVKNSMDDTGDGFVGFVHQSFIDNYLSKHNSPEDIEFYFCGPPMMNKAVLKMCDDWGVPKENVLFDDFGG